MGFFETIHSKIRITSMELQLLYETILTCIYGSTILWVIDVNHKKLIKKITEVEHAVIQQKIEENETKEKT